MNEVVKTRVTILAALLLGYAIIGLAIGGFVFILLTGIAIASGDAEAVWVLTTVGTGVAILFAIGSVPSLIAGVALLKQATWSRVVTLIASAINIFNFPFGTALAIYAIIVLSQPDVSYWLDSGGKDDGTRPGPPEPPPTSASPHGTIQTNG